MASPSLFFSAMLVSILGVEISNPRIHDVCYYERIVSNVDSFQNPISQLPGAPVTPGAPGTPGTPGAPSTPSTPDTDPIIDEDLINLRLQRVEGYLNKAFRKYEDAEKVFSRARRKLSKNEDYLDDLQKKSNRIDFSSKAQSMRFRNDIKFAQKKMNRNLKDYLDGSKSLSEMIKELDKLSRELLRF